jgi:hypothetical protein
MVHLPRNPGFFVVGYLLCAVCFQAVCFSTVCLWCCVYGSTCGGCPPGALWTTLTSCRTLWAGIRVQMYAAALILGRICCDHYAAVCFVWCRTGQQLVGVLVVCTKTHTSDHLPAVNPQHLRGRHRRWGHGYVCSSYAAALVSAGCAGVCLLLFVVCSSLVL